MSTLDIIYEIDILPETAQGELLNFLAFLKFKYKNMKEDEYRELEKNVLTERYKRLKSGEVTSIPYEDTINKMKAKYGKV